MHEVIFQDDSYRVLSHHAERGDRQPFVISFSAFKKSHDALEGRDFKPGFGVDPVLSLGLNCLSFSTNKNDWYQGKTADDAIAAINAFIPPGSRIITYGSSMGGFAAINFSEKLNADYFLSISPQASIGAAFAASIGDKRWTYESSVLELQQDHIVNGGAVGRKGVILYDDRLGVDARHALQCGKTSSGYLLPIPFSGHPAGPAANRHYGLKRMLLEIACGKFDPALAAVEIATRNLQSLNYLAADFRNAEAFAARLLAHPEELTAQTVILLVESLQAEGTRPSALVLAYYAAVLRENEGLFGRKVGRYRKLQGILDEAIAVLVGSDA